MSHEIVEAATDPLAITQQAFGQVAGPDLAWAVSIPTSGPISLAGEAADLCSYEEGQSNLYAWLVGDFMVQRSWFNAAALANQDPCVPAVAEVYFNAAPDLYEPVTLRLSDAESYVTNGVRVPLHESRTVDVRLFSTGKRPDWYVTASDIVAAAGGPTSLEFQWDRPTGNDGAFLRLTITRTAEGPIGGSPIYIYSTNGPSDFDTGTVWAGFVGN